MPDEQRLEQTIQLTDGRQLCYAEFGDPGGSPLMYFHGTPSCRLEGGWFESEVNKRGIRLIAPDRPGFGRSDPKPGRTLLDWADDVVELADVLGLERFALMGASGGGPFTVACARRIPDRLTVVGVVCGAGPLDAPNATQGIGKLNRFIFALGRRTPWLLRPLYRLIANSMKGDPDKLVQRVASMVPEPDAIVLQRPNVMQNTMETFQEAVRQGVASAAQEVALNVRPWGFDLKDVRVRVHLWQGERDQNISPAMARYQAETIPDAELTLYEDEGHVSLPLNRISEILAVLMPQAGPSEPPTHGS